jgi:hypothetical protein
MRQPAALLGTAAAAGLLAAVGVGGVVVTLRNDVPRVDTNGNVVDAHSGMILPVNGTFYLIGEHYGNTTGFGPSPPLLYPKIVVYTSPDLVTWTFRGFAFSSWPTMPYGTFFTPWVVYDKTRNKFVMWLNAYLNGCCEAFRGRAQRCRCAGRPHSRPVPPPPTPPPPAGTGNFGIGESDDGLSYTFTSLDTTGTYAIADCNSLLVDDDGTGYVLYSSEAQDHRHSIDRLTPNFTGIVPGANGGLFPDHYTEGGVLFKRNGTYYVGYGSCCCFCRGGAGWVLYSAPSIAGPWTRQPLDLNCDRTDAGDICGAYGERAGDPITITAQGIGLSVIPLADGSSAYLWHGERWLSAPNNNPSCPDECQAESGQCAEPPNYIKGNGFAYWIPLVFNPDGTVQRFANFTASFTLDIAEGFGTAHLPGPAAAPAAAPAA